MRSLILLIFLAYVAISANAQPAVITGKVTNARGEPVSYATVTLRGTKVSVAADIDGEFSIHGDRGQTLVVTATNYGSQSVLINADHLDIHLSVQENALSEVVVTALGQSQNKAKLGYSAASFGSTTITKNAPVGMLDGLAGKIAGAEISTTGGPGSSTKVILRGFGVIAGGNNQPLYVIDGVPLSDNQFQNTSNTINALTNTTDFGNGMNDVNPNDIESITVLKGTAASSLYGGLAKNGAIMITTKKGHAGKLKVEYSGAVTLSKVGKLPDYESEFGQGWGGVFVLSENGSWGPKLDGQERLWGSIVDHSQLEKPFSFQKNNIRDFYTTGNELNNTIALSGGNDITRFYFSYGNVSSDGVIPTTSDYLERNTFALRTNSNFSNFAINSSFNYVNRRQNAVAGGQTGSDGGGIFQSLLQIPVDIPINNFRDYTNKFFNVDNYFTPYAENPYFGLNENGDVQHTDRFFGNVDMSLKFLSYFTAQLRVGGDFTDARTKDWKQVASANPGSWNAGGNVEGFPRTPDVGSVTEASDNVSVLNGDFILKFNKDLGTKFNVEALAGANYYENRGQSQATEVTNLVVPGFFNLSNTSLPPTTASTYFLQRRMGIYAQATLSYADQLYLTGNIRNDWSSTLPIDNNSILYPGANLSWVASQNFNSRNIISFLKFRAAYGETGSEPAPYLTYPSLATGTINLPFGSLITPFNGVSGFRISNNIANSSLKPVFTTELEFGSEIRFFNDRIGLDVTVYDKKDDGQIFPITIAPSTGYSTLTENLGVVSNRGVEITLNLRPIETKDFVWSLIYTYAKNDNRVINLTGGTLNPVVFGITNGPELRAVVGKSVASIYAPVPQKTPDGKIVVDATTGFPSINQTPLDQFGLKNGYFGSGLYDYTMGLSNNFQYKSFSLSFSLDFRYGGVMYSQTASEVLFDGNGIATTYNDRRPFIVPNSVNAVTDGTGKTVYVENTTFVGPGSVALGGQNPGGGSGQTDFHFGYYNPSYNQGGGYGYQIFDRSFLKLRDVNLSFTLPHAWSTKISATNASLGIYARNFLLWTPKANVYVDPEATNLGNDLGGELGEFATAPLSKSYGIILKLVF